MIILKKESQDNLGRITLTGIAKFAIINMIKEGINKANIKLITGMRDVVVDDCEKRFLYQQFKEENDICLQCYYFQYTLRLKKLIRQTCQ